ncbi:MAG: ABC transporter substrate-binding protein [Nitrososphaerota archaeon]|nr:ABC transporter substrate-binding protein [Nitrososphaerota archaeon]
MSTEKRIDRRTYIKYIGSFVAGAIIFGGGIAAYYATMPVKEKIVEKTIPGPTVTETKTIPGPTVTVPGPTVTVTKEVPKTVKLKDPIKIGAQATLSGPYAGYGEFMKKGAIMAVEEINATGGIFGSKIAIEFRDEELKPDVAAKNARWFVDEWKADFMVGVDSSSSVLGICEIIKDLNRIFICTHASTERLNEEYVYAKGVKQMFRISAPIYQDSIAPALIAKDFPIKRWALMVPDYAYGWTCEKWFKEYLSKARPDVEFVEVTKQKFGTLDFTPFLTKILAAKPEGVYCAEWAGPLVTLIRQATGLGLFKEVKVFMSTLGAAIDVLEALKGEMPPGIWMSTRYWFLYPPTKVNMDFVDRFYKRWGTYPHYVSETTYSAIYAIKYAVEKAESLDVDACIKALEGMTLITPAGRRWFRPEDHQALYEVPWGRTTMDPKYPFAIMTDMKILPAEVYYRHPPFK